MSMIKPPLFKAPKFLLLALIGIALASCSKDRRLPNGFVLAAHDSGNVTIMETGSDGVLQEIVPGVIQEYGVVGNIVCGRIEPHPYPDRTDHNSAGYFIFDTTSGATELGMDREEFQTKFEKMGLNIPELIAP